MDSNGTPPSHLCRSSAVYRKGNKAFGKQHSMPAPEPAEDNLLCTPTIVIDDVDDCPMSENFLSMMDPYLHFKTLSLDTAKDSYRKAIATSVPERKANSLQPPESVGAIAKESRVGSSYVDWTDCAVYAEHLFTNTSVATDFCYVGPLDCLRSGARQKCSACKIVVHTACLQFLEKGPILCKPTFREANPRNYRGDTRTRHHWVHQRKENGKCRSCNKSFQKKYFQSREILALRCSWCKVAYHNRPLCFKEAFLYDDCPLGIHGNMIVPPTWIIKMLKRNSFKSSIRKKKQRTSQKRKRYPGGNNPFVLKPVPSSVSKPLVVFVNPKSGGKMGAKLMQQFQWLLNPRQVFDLTQGGPCVGLELYRKVPNLQILVCGGDGTVGWVLSDIDKLAIEPSPPVAILPLGTGNDLSRTLKWGGGYTDEPISKVLFSIDEGKIVKLDRWNISVSPNMEEIADTADAADSADRLPLSVMNNYFSLGADAHVAFKFHESREANPDKFNSRFWNKVKYMKYGGIDHFVMEQSDLCNNVTLECDGQDYTAKVVDLKLHCLLFLSIPNYSAGTNPWGNPGQNWLPQRHDDGILEVIGFYTKELAMLYNPLPVGSPGERICQCKEVRLITKKTIPMQVDGEPCRLQPSVIKISFRNCANMIRKIPKRKGSVPLLDNPSLDDKQLTVTVKWLSFAKYEEFHSEYQDLKSAATVLSTITIKMAAKLNTAREAVDSILKGTSPKLEVTEDQFSRLTLDHEAGKSTRPKSTEPTSAAPFADWLFVDFFINDNKGCCFRIQPEQEEQYYAFDIIDDKICMYIVEDTEDPAMPADSGQRSPKISDDQDDAQIHRQNAILRPAPPRAIIVHNIDADGGANGCIAFQMPDTPPSTDIGSVPGYPDKRWSQPGGAVDQVAPLPSRPPGQAYPGATTSTLTLPKQDKMMFDAVKGGQVERVREMLNLGANVLATDDSGMTVLHHAANLGYKDIAEIILRTGQKKLVDMTDFHKGQTALHYAACLQRRNICKLLVDAGASLIIEDYAHNTPLNYAVHTNDVNLIKYLEDHQHFQEIVKEDQETAV